MDRGQAGEVVKTRRGNKAYGCGLRRTRAVGCRKNTANLWPAVKTQQNVVSGNNKRQYYYFIVSARRFRLSVILYVFYSDGS